MTVQKVGTSPRCPRCGWPLEPEPYGDYHCAYCGRDYRIMSGAPVPLSDLWQQRPDPIEDERKLKKEQRQPWQPTSGYIGVSGAAEALKVSVRSVWNAIQATGISPSQDHHHTVLMPDELEELEKYRSSLRVEMVTFADGTLKVSPSVAAKEVGFSDKWVRELVKQAVVSGFIGAQVASLAASGLISGFVPEKMWVDLEALKEYQAGQQSQPNDTPIRLSRPQWSPATDVRVSSGHFLD